MSNILENGSELQLDFTKLKQVAQTEEDLIPVVLQDAHSKDVLWIAYTNREAFELTLERKTVVLYSTSRRELWEKGKTSGDVLKLVEVRVNCEQNSLLYIVEKTHNGVCHTRNAQGETRPTCYYRRVLPPVKLEFLEETWK